MSVEEKIMEKVADVTFNKPLQNAAMHTGKPSGVQLGFQEMVLRNYVPVVMQHIRDHGCSGLKCKRCPLNKVCDRDASKSKDLANQMIAYANTLSVKK